MMAEAPQPPPPDPAPAPPPLRRFPGAKPTTVDLIWALTDASPEDIRTIRRLLGLEPDP